MLDGLEKEARIPVLRKRARECTRDLLRDESTLHYTYMPWLEAASSSAMGFREFLRSANAIFKLAHKSDLDEFGLYLKLVALGLGVVGIIGFLIKLIGSIFFG